MKTLNALPLLVVLAVQAASGAEAPADAGKNNSLEGLFYFSSTNGFSLRVEPKTIADSGAIGLDYELKYDRPFAADTDVAKSRFGAEALSRGFIATRKLDSQNSLISELRLTGNLLLKDNKGPLPPLQQMRVREILDFPDQFNLPAPLKREFEELMQSEPLRFATFDGHVKYESDQSFDNSQLAAGVGFASDLNFITGNNWPARFFDFPFALTRSADANQSFKARPPRFYVGYDYVNADQNDARAQTTSDDNLNRLTLQAAWSSLAFDLVELRASVQAYYEVDASRAIRDSGKEWTSFFEISAGIPIDAKKRKKIFLKYANGELPPTLKESSNVSIGFSMELGGFE